MTIARKLIKKLKRKNISVDPRLFICIECGSDQVVVKGKNQLCKNCGVKRKFKKVPRNTPNFSEGENVRIIEYGKPSEQVYKIRKIRKAKDNQLEFLIKSDESDITLLYKESINSHLEKAD